MSEKEVHQNPLLYIEQRGTIRPKAEMQTYYRSERENTNVSNQSSKEDSLLESLSDSAIAESQEGVRKNHFHHLLERRVPNPEIKTEIKIEKKDHKEKIEESKEVINEFNNLSLKEKINYLLSEESSFSKKHTIIATDNDYIGTVIDYKEHHVYLKQKNQEEPIQLFIENIEDIQID